MTQFPTGLVASTPYDLVRQCARQQRSAPRFSFSLPLEATDRNSNRRYVFCRDISANGIGLLTRGCLANERLAIRVPAAFGSPLEIQAKPAWSHPIGSGWYLSGGQFSGSTQRDRIRLWLTKRLESLRQRASQRYPFYRPVKICYELHDKEPTDAFARDISTGGLGLVHETPIKSEVAFFTVFDGSQVLEFRMKNVWAKRRGSELFISGWKFKPRTRVMEKL